jgi:hypothetical protein
MVEDELLEVADDLAGQRARERVLVVPQGPAVEVTHPERRGEVVDRAPEHVLGAEPVHHRAAPVRHGEASLAVDDEDAVDQALEDRVELPEPAPVAVRLPDSSVGHHVRAIGL